MTIEINYSCNRHSALEQVRSIPDEKPLGADGRRVSILCSMGMGRQIVVGVIVYSVMMVARSTGWIYVDRDMRKIPEVVEKLMAYLYSNFMALFNGKLRVYSYIHFSM